MYLSFKTLCSSSFLKLNFYKKKKSVIQRNRFFFYKSSNFLKKKYENYKKNINEGSHKLIIKKKFYYKFRIQK